MLELNKIYNMDCLKGLKQLPDNSINCCVTSPPYWGLRDYGIDGQIGLEGTPEEYVDKLVQVFREVKRVLRDDGCLWLNLGDSYNGSGGAGGDYSPGGLKDGQPKYPGRNIGTLKPKDLVGIPWRIAFALQADGWYLRSDIIWHKPNPMPESVTDRPTKAHEYIFLLSKTERYFYDAEAIKEKGVMTNAGGRQRDTRETHGMGGGNGGINKAKERMKKELAENGFVTRNKRSVWTVATKPFKEAHFAVFPPDLIKPCILAGCPEGGVVLDPFMGSGTTGMVAAMYQRNFIGFELNQEYCKMAEKRIEPYLMQQTIFELLKGGQR